jgi:DNA-binding NtrC family response regulator
VPVGSPKVVKANARILAATNADLERLANEGRFRNDLFARLAGAVLRLPSLRERRSDIPLLIARFQAELSPTRPLRISPSALERILLHPWTRNVRELRTFVQRLTLYAGETAEVTVTALDRVLDPQPPTKLSMVSTPTGTLDTTLTQSGEKTPDQTPREPGPSHHRRPSREELLTELERCQGNITKLAAHYRKDSKQVYRWLKRWGIDPDPFRRG